MMSVFWLYATEPRLQFIHFEKDDITFQLRDSDTFLQGKMVAHKVDALCMPTTGVAFEKFIFFKGRECKLSFPWLMAFVQRKKIDLHHR